MKQSHNIPVKMERGELTEVKEEKSLKRDGKLAFKEEEKESRASKEAEVSLIKIPLELEQEPPNSNDNFSSFSKSVCNKLKSSFHNPLQFEMPKLPLPED